MSRMGQTRPRRLSAGAVVARPVFLSNQMHFGPVESWQPWANSGLSHRKMSGRDRKRPGGFAIRIDLKKLMPK